MITWVASGCQGEPFKVMLRTLAGPHQEAMTISRDVGWIPWAFLSPMWNYALRPWYFRSASLPAQDYSLRSATLGTRSRMADLPHLPTAGCIYTDVAGFFCPGISFTESFKTNIGC